MRQNLPAKEATRLDRFDLLRFPLIVLVIYIHAAAGTTFFADNSVTVESNLLSSAQIVISQGIARVAVPCFYFISGFLFFRSHSNFINSYFVKVRSRAQTLLLPYIFWNIVTYVAILAAQSIPQTNSYFNSNNARLSDLDLFGMLDLMLGLTRYPIAYQFWFIRDLIILSILSPLVYLIASKFPLCGLGSLLVLWVAGLWPIYIPAIEPVFFFFLGATLAVNKISPFIFEGEGAYAMIIYAILLVCGSYLHNNAYGYLFHKASVIVGLVVTLYLGGVVNKLPRIEGVLRILSPASFFVFAIHEPLLTVFRKISYRLLPPNPDVALLLYLSLPIVVVAVALTGYVLLMNAAPSLTTLVTGGRSSGK